MLAGDESPRAISADGRDVTLVPIPERNSWAALDPAENVLRRPRAGLNRCRSDTGDGNAAGRHRGEIADDEDLGVSGDAQVGLDDDASLTIRFRAELFAER